LDFTQAHHIAVYYHPLIGGKLYTVDWVNQGHFSREELSSILKERITRMLTHRGRCAQYVDVVNEALDAGKSKSSGNDGKFDWRTKDHAWFQGMGMWHGKRYDFPEYLVEAFRTAREVGGPDLKLNLNEYGNATYKSQKGKPFLALVKAMREEGIPIDGVGMQMHCTLQNGKLIELGSSEPFDFESFDSMLEAYAKEGIDVHITELDIGLSKQPTQFDYELQGKYYTEILKHALASTAVKTFKVWGYCDVKDSFSGPHGLIFDEKLKPKPAYQQMHDFMTNTLSRESTSK
jgi:endo-1,4-beta-xylanase